MASESESEKRETLADIVADLRGRADCAERHGDRETHNDGVAMFLRSIADRIEAIDSADAWRSLYTPGNSAAMREALVWMSERMNAAVHDGSFDCYEALRKIEAALSAPARNCDLARDWLQDLYCKFKPPAAVRREMPPEWVDAVMAFCKWLLAPAAELKKDGKGDGAR